MEHKKHKKIDISALMEKKAAGEKISMLTAYDYPTGRILDMAGVDSVLVGDSAANVVLGYPNTIPVSMDEMIMLTKAVSRAMKYSFLIGDMPFLSYNVSIHDSIQNAGRFLKEAGVQAVKLEGGTSSVETLDAMTKAGIPVVGHLGLTPQTANQLGGHRVQGKVAEAAKKIYRDALLLESAGAIMIVVECIPDRLAELLSKSVKVPIIGIGSGSHCDGQVLVLHDMLGYHEFKPRFVKRYAEMERDILQAVAQYSDDVRSSAFPGQEHSFQMDDAEYEKLLKSI